MPTSNKISSVASTLKFQNPGAKEYARRMLVRSPPWSSSLRENLRTYRKAKLEITNMKLL